MKLVEYPHPALRKKALPVRLIDSKFKILVKEMFDLLYTTSGVGLAANQVNIPLKFFITNTSPDKEPGMERVYINPVITDTYGMSQVFEGCLSFPGLNIPIRRPVKTTIQYIALTGETVNEEMEGMESHIVQHEIDHLNGVLIIDKVNELYRPQMNTYLEELEIDFLSKQKTGNIEQDAVILESWEPWITKYGAE